jgi:hypothetical protein
MGIFCSTTDDEVIDVTTKKYLGATCRTVGMSEHLESPPTFIPPSEFDDDKQLFQESGSLYVSAKRRRDRISQRKNGAIKTLTIDPHDGARIDLVLKVKSERKVATLTDSDVGRLLENSNSNNNTTHRVSDSSTETNNTSVYDSLEEPTKKKKNTSNVMTLKFQKGRPRTSPVQREKVKSILHDMETEIDLGRPVTYQRKIQQMTDAEVEKILSRSIERGNREQPRKLHRFQPGTSPVKHGN